MKRTLLFAAFSANLFVSSVAHAQPGVGTVTKFVPKPMLGIKVGADFNQLSAGENFKQAYKPGILVGAFGGVRWKKVGIRVEAMINSAKYDYSVSGAQDGSFKNLYLDIPVLFEYKLIPRIWLQVGPQYSEVLSVKNPDLPSPKDFFKSSDFSGVIGLEARLPLHLVAGARYILGITDIRNQNFNSASDSWNTRTIQLYAGIRFL
jgi:hypothetical protein